MAATSPNMGLLTWNSTLDPYDSAQLAGNFARLDQHDHANGRGVQIPTAGIADSAITRAKIANDVTLPTSFIAASQVGTTELADNAVTNAKMADEAITHVEVAAANRDGSAETLSLRTLGAAATQAAPGDNPLVAGTFVGFTGGTIIGYVEINVNGSVLKLAVTDGGTD